MIFLQKILICVILGLPIALAYIAVNTLVDFIVEYFKGKKNDR